MKKFIIEPKNMNGSIEHYFHFMFGYMLPFVQATVHSDDSEYVFYDCGPVMNNIIKTFPRYNLKQLSEITQTNNYQKISFLPSDDIKFPNLDIEDIRRKMFDIFDVKRNDEKYLLLIDRKYPHEFYLSKSKIKESGTLRRSLPNIKEIHESLCRSHNTKLVYLEDKSLKEQIELFYNATHIVLQHGASMANLIWCNKNTLVIEISNRERAYSRLIKQCSLRYVRINQSHEHEMVDPEIIANAVTSPQNTIKQL